MSLGYVENDSIVWALLEKVSGLPTADALKLCRSFATRTSRRNAYQWARQMGLAAIDAVRWAEWPAERKIIVGDSIWRMDLPKVEELS